MEPEIDVRTVSAVCSRLGTELLRLADGAEVIALGIDLTRRRFGHRVWRTLADRVAAHAHCPVVAVAPGSFLMPGSGDQVSVGGIGNRTTQLALEAAAEEAVVRGASLIVVTVSPFLDPQAVGAIEPPLRDSPVLAAIGDLEERYPGLAVNISHQTGDVTAALGAVAADSELLVLGVYHSTKPWSMRIGPVATALTGP